jgi:AcrR family transcriptional regulator
MDQKKEDLRIKRTHKLLYNAMFSLLETKSFDDISVVDICDKAMVHRATFYKHFNDKYDFIEFITKEKLVELYKESIQSADFSDKELLYKSIINTVVKYVEKNKQMFQIAAKCSNVAYLSSTSKIIHSSLVKFIATSEKYGETYRTPADVIASFLTGGFVSLLNWWITEENDYSADDIQKYLENFIFMSESR